MFEQHISSDLLIHHEHNKIPSGNLYLRQQHTVIQLVEVAPPPPRRISSVINSSSAASSSYTSSSSSSSSSFEEDLEENEEEDEDERDEDGSSYCSSDDMPLDEMDLPKTPHSISGSMKRILLWREQSPYLIADSTSSMKRKVEQLETDIVDNDDNISRTSKRSRSTGSSSSVSSDRSIISLELGMHSCPACDAFFPTPQSLRQHGQNAQSNACSEAVEYAFE